MIKADPFLKSSKVQRKNKAIRVGFCKEPKEISSVNVTNFGEKVTWKCFVKEHVAKFFIRNRPEGIYKNVIVPVRRQQRPIFKIRIALYNRNNLVGTAQMCLSILNLKAAQGSPHFCSPVTTAWRHLVPVQKAWRVAESNSGQLTSDNIQFTVSCLLKSISVFTAM